jgi:hypothetical protein
MKSDLAAGRQLLNSIKTVCQRLDRSRTYVYGLLARGVLKSVYVGTSQMIPEDGEGGLQEYVASLLSADDSAPSKKIAATQRAVLVRAERTRRRAARKAVPTSATAA